jgi:glyoxylate reductase
VKPRVYVTYRIPPPFHEILQDQCELEYNPREEPIPRSELLRAVREKDGLVCMVSEKIDAELMDQGKGLRVVSSYSVGFDHISIPEATKRGVYITNTPGVLTEATADLTWTLLMTVARRIVESDNYLRQGRWRTWAPDLMVGADVHGMTLGIVGLGRIGAAVARRARGFNMRILYYDVIDPPAQLVTEVGAQKVTLEKLLAESDFVTLHVPLTEETRHIMNEKTLRMMKSTAYLINASRGPMVDEPSLARALKEKWIAGAALDVYEQEPLSMSSPLLSLRNLVLVPHIGSATTTSRAKMAELAAKNLLLIFQGKPPLHLVNPDVLKMRPVESLKMI